MIRQWIASQWAELNDDQQWFLIALVAMAVMLSLLITVGIIGALLELAS